MHQFTNADVEQLLKIQNEVRDLLRKYAERTPAMVPAVALIRVAKELIDVYPDAERVETIDTVIIPFLKGETQQRPPKSGLILPPGLSN